MEKQGDRILEATLKIYKELRDATLDTIFSLADCGSIDKYDALYVIESNNLLPLGGDHSECPKCLDFATSTYCFNRYQIMYFLLELDILDYTKEDDKQKYLDEVYAYVKEHRIIGTVNDW